jgi:hypothetical protein
MIIMSDETLSSATLTANSNIINYPTTNILDSRIDRLFRTDSSTTATIVFDAGAAVTVDSINIANHNISASVTTLKWQGNATDSWGSPSVDETLTHTTGIITKQFTGGSYRYWRLHIIDGSNPDGYIEIGRVSGCDAYTTVGISPNVTHDLVDAGVKTTSISGGTYYDGRYFYEQISVSYPSLTHTQKGEMWAIFRAIGYGTPFFVTFDESGSDLGTLYVTIDQDSINTSLLINSDYYTFGLSLREEK